MATFRATLERNPDADAIRYFDGRITFGEPDRLTDAFAAALAGTGFAPGDRVALYPQNVPQFVIAQLGTWKAGGIAVSINPMNRERELQLLLQDSGARVLVSLQDLYRDVASKVEPIGTEPISASPVSCGGASRTSTDHPLLRQRGRPGKPGILDARLH